ncbi:MAG: FAD/NAD(P)-binding protein, partial [Pseudomonadota bacterium]
MVSTIKARSRTIVQVWQFRRRFGLYRHSLFSRRAFLALSAGATAAATYPPRATFAKESPDRLDIAIIGGGVAGLYCAYRLAAETGATVALFEGSDRVGGRIASAQFPGYADLPAEKSAMRLRRSDQITLKLAEVLLGQAALGHDASPINGYFLRNRGLTGFSDLYTLPYDLDRSETELLARGGNLTRDSVNALRKKHSALSNWGLRELLFTQCSRDGVQFIQDTIGSETIVSNW